MVEQPIIIRVLDDEHFIDKLNSIKDNLELVQRALGAFLEKQRSKSPRLFFVGDDDLLDIISITSSKSLLNMQKHWRKMFMGIDRILFGSAEKEGELEQIIGFASRQNEQVMFNETEIQSIKA